ncbi:MAG: cupin domain-containing protein, partial [Syntrophomonadaceae bacterium]|nr:cupin domain-containing protein [Syntrophomonadaceae bacterium]
PPGFWYEQEKDEWVLLLQGEAIISYRNNDKVLMKTGDYLLIPAKRAHRVDMTSIDPPCIWLAIFFPSCT